MRVALLDARVEISSMLTRLNGNGSSEMPGEAKRDSGFEFQSLQARNTRDFEALDAVPFRYPNEGTQARRYLRMPSFEMTDL